MARSNEWMRFVCKQTKNYLFWLIKYPCYSYEQLIKRKEIIGDVSEEDFKEYTRTSTKVDTRRRHTIWALICLIFAIKNISVPYLTVLKLDFKSPYANGSNAWHIVDNIYQVVCIQTNCTQFIIHGTGQTQDLRHFPVLPVCYPNYNKLFLPTTYLGPFSMILHAMFGFSVFVFGVVLPLSQIRSPLTCDPLMFVIAPEFTKEIMILRAKEIYYDLKSSWINFLSVSQHKDIVRRLPSAMPKHLQRLSTQPEITTFYELGRREQSLASASAAERGLVRGGLNYDYEVDVSSSHGALATKDDNDEADDCAMMQFLVHCLPFVRTMWWRSKAEVLFVRILIIGMLFLIIQTTATATDVLERIFVRSEELKMMRQSEIEADCKEWYSIEPEERIYLQMDRFQIDLHVYAFADNVFLFALFMIGPCVVANAYLIYSELTCWRLELENELRILNEITRLRCIDNDCHKSARESLVGGVVKNRTEQLENAGETCKYNSSHIYGKIRHEFFKNNVLGRLAFKTAPFQRTDLLPDGSEHKLTSLNSKIGIQQLVIGYMIEEKVSSDTYIKLMEKTYISFRLFMGHVEHCSKTSPPLTFVSHMLCYGTIVVSVWHSRLLQQFSYEHMVIVAISCLSSLTMITLMSDFHAKVST